jgi:hypothetical protein
MPRRPHFVRRLRSGDIVVRRHRLLKTQGIVLGFGGEDYSGFSRAWIRWDHPNTLPNPSLEAVDSLELLAEGIRDRRADRPVTGREARSETPARSRPKS